MLQELRIRNFRIFKDLHLKELSRLNLIAGKNNSGKTSLLEAVFLLAGAGRADMLMNVNVLRSETGDVAQRDAYWKPLFYDLDVRKKIEIKGSQSAQRQFALEISGGARESIENTEAFTEGSSVTTVPEIRTLRLKYRSPKRKNINSRLTVQGSDVRIEQPNARAPFDATILKSRTANHQEDAIRLGRLRKQKRDFLLLKALQVIEPRLQSIEDNSASGTPSIWGDIGLSELVPLAVMGEGMGLLARLVLAISNSPNGIVLVDEVENGIYHSVLHEAWRAIDTASKQFNTQIFATTHSSECIRAAQESLSEHDFRLHRLEDSDDGIQCVTYDPETITAALDFNLEVR